MKKITFLSFLIASVTSFYGYSAQPFTGIAGDWARKTLARLTTEEKIGQLFVAATVIDPKFYDLRAQKIVANIDQTPIEKLIQDYHVGGLLFLGKTTTAQRQLEFTRRCQRIAKIPLLITQDLEWGLSMRLHNTVRFPRNMTLGALQDDELIYEMGKEVGRQCKLLGVHVNFAPVVDVNNNAKNPVIGNRSFGEDERSVARKAILFMRGLQDTGVIACAKHFPGHGDTAVDSHLALPHIGHQLERLHRVELFPFKQMIDAGILSIMTAHLEVPALEQKPQCPATLSHSIVTLLLQETFGFKGLVITDALNMKSVIKHHRPGELELQALRAGNTLLLCSKNIRQAIECIKQALQDGLFTQEELDARVLNILYAKEWAFKHGDMPAIDLDITDALHTSHAYALKRQLYEGAITLVRDEHQLLPLATHSSVAYLHIGNDKKGQPFVSTLQKSMDVTNYSFPVDATPEKVNSLLSELEQKENVIVGVYSSSSHSFHYVNEELLGKMGKKVILVLFVSPYTLRFFEHVPAVIAAYEDDPDAQRAAAKVIVGSFKPRGRLPIIAS